MVELVMDWQIWVFDDIWPKVKLNSMTQGRRAHLSAKAKLLFWYHTLPCSSRMGWTNSRCAQNYTITLDAKVCLTAHSHQKVLLNPDWAIKYNILVGLQTPKGVKIAHTSTWPPCSCLLHLYIPHQGFHLTLPSQARAAAGIHPRPYFRPIFRALGI